MLINREIGFRLGEITNLNLLGSLCLRLGNLPQAQAHFQQSLRLSWEAGHRRGECESLSNLAYFDQARGDDAGAVEHSRQVVEIARALEDDGLVAHVLACMGYALTGTGRLAEARAAHQEAIRLQQQVGLPHLAMDSLGGLARVYLAVGSMEQAVACVDQILDHEQTATLAGVDDPFWIYLACYLVLAEAGDGREKEVLSRAHALLEAQAANIGDEALRRCFLEEVPHHREIDLAYRASQTGTAPLIETEQARRPQRRQP